MIHVFTSTVADGNMLKRDEPFNPAVIANRDRFLSKRGIKMEQTTHFHPLIVQREREGDNDFCRYLEIDASYMGVGVRDDTFLNVDAVVTRDSNHALFLPVADCVATTIYDPTHHIVMLTHLGRHSLAQYGGTRSVEYLIEHCGSHPADLLVWSTPAPNKAVYPLWSLEHKGMKEAWFEQLYAAGIKPENISDNAADSATDVNYYSYSEYLKGNRAEDGDFAMVAMIAD